MPVADGEGDAAAFRYILRIEDVVKHADGVVAGCFRHDKEADGHGWVFFPVFCFDAVGDGVLPALEPAGDDVRPPFISEFMFGDAVDTHADVAPGAVDEDFADEFRGAAGDGNAGQRRVGLESILLAEDAEVLRQQPLAHDGQFAEVEEACLVKFPFAALIDKLEYKGVVGGLSVAQLEFAQVGGSQGAPVAAGDGSNVAEVFQSRRFRLVLEVVAGERSSLRDDEVSHLDLPRGACGAAPCLFVAAGHADAPGVVDGVCHFLGHGLVGGAEAGRISRGAVLHLLRGALLHGGFQSGGGGLRRCLWAGGGKKQGGGKKNGSHNGVELTTDLLS